MRVLHTSDWHLGRKLGEHALLGEQAKFCDWLVDLVAAEGVELVAISGDLFDRSIPPTEAIELLNSTFLRIRDAGAVVAAIAGNHDSARRLGIAEGFTEAGGLHLRGGYSRLGAVTSVAVGEDQLQLVSIPFLDPRMAPSEVVEAVGRQESTVTHESVLQHALAEARATLDPSRASLVLSHAFVTNARPSPSERELSVGDAAMVSADVFAGFDYVALGHLHQPQVVGGQPHLRYSGSPLPYSFSETASKSVLLAELGGRGDVAVREVPIGVGRRVCTVRGKLEDLASDRGNSVDWVRAELTDELRPTDAARLLRANHPYLAQVDWVGGNSAPVGSPSLSQIRIRSTDELICDFWTESCGAPPSPEVRAVVAEALAGTDDAAVDVDEGAAA
ncbi:MAG: metallophosphoesterase family protein [Microthrixaceae bacterium]